MDKDARLVPVSTRGIPAPRLNRAAALHECRFFIARLTLAARVHLFTRMFSCPSNSKTTSSRTSRAKPIDRGSAGASGRAQITQLGFRDGKQMLSGKITEIIARKDKRFAGSLGRLSGQWVVFPDGNVLTEPILTPDAASRHIKPETKVVVELTSYPGEPIGVPASAGMSSAGMSSAWAQGVITEVLGQAGEK